jgi:hypothetical protein
MRVRKAYSLYRIVLFIGLTLFVLYEVFARSAPKLTLIFIPVCIILALGFYQIFKRS